jgi:hypothetical protein
LLYKYNSKLAYMKKYIGLYLLLIMAAAGCKSEIDFSVKATPPPPPPQGNTDLVISELATAINTDPVAGGVRNHYVELYNGTTGAVDLSNYAIGYQAVTDMATLSAWSFPSGNYFVMTGSLAKGKCYVIASPQAYAPVVIHDTIWGTTSTTNANAVVPLQLSGNSAIALLKKDPTGSITINSITYKIIDCFGSPLVARLTSTGASSARNNIIWAVAGESADTRNRTFFRKSTVTGPTDNWAVAAGTTATDSQWQLSGDRAWDYTNLGLPTH